jgi:mRNA interferase HigB
VSPSAAATSMRVVGVGKLRAFEQKHGDDLRGQFDAWLREVADAAWASPTEIRSRYILASFSSRTRVLFQFGLGKYCVDTKISFESQVVLVVRVGTDKEADSWSS